MHLLLAVYGIWTLAGRSNCLLRSRAEETSEGTLFKFHAPDFHLAYRTLPYVVSELQPLRDHGYLTTFENGVLTTGPVTVLGTGNTPLEGVQRLNPRDFFY